MRRAPLGQHFLSSKRVVHHMCEAAHIEASDTVLEIGPGKGVLTEALLARARKVIAIEKDPRLVSLLKERFAQEIKKGVLSLHPADVRDVSLKELGLSRSPYLLIANIPYYLTGAILRRFLSERNKPQRAVLLLQKEVAERIAKSKKGSILSQSVRAYGTPSLLEVVPAQLFRPRPKVDSAILVIENISGNFFKDLDETFFFTVLRTGFGKKRKQLLSNLSALAPREKVAEIFTELGLRHDIRAEDVDTETWKALATHLKTVTIHKKARK